MAQRARRFQLESLEPKQMLAGDVAVSVVNGTLFVQGDELDNQIAITSGETPGSYVIRGLAGTNVSMDDGDSPTDAAATQQVVVNGVRHGIHARMGEGDDVVHLNDLQTRGNVTIATGEGSDIVRVGRGPNLPEMSDDDRVPLAEPSVAIGGNLLIRTGNGDDTVVVDHTVGRGRLAISTGADSDAVRIGQRDLQIMGEDEETGENGGVSQFAPDVRFAAVNLHLGAGDDTASVSDTTARHSVSVQAGAGNDGVRLAGVRAQTIAIDGGRGEFTDKVAIRDSSTRLLFAALGDGNDVLTLGGVRAQLALLSGGRGDGDALNEVAENFIRRQRVIGFELPSTDDPDGMQPPAVEIA